MSGSKRRTKTSEGIRVFVYGTLKKGHPNHGLLAESKYLGRCRIKGRLAMLDFTAYPCVVRTEGRPDHPSRMVYGEVYRVDEATLHALDVLEGNGFHFTRSKVDTPWKKAWMYFLPTEVLDRGLSEIESGTWHPTPPEKRWITTQRRRHG